MYSCLHQINDDISRLTEYLVHPDCLTLQEHHKALATVYHKYSMLDPVAGKPTFGLEEWKVNY